MANIISTHTSYNREVPTQRTMLWLERAPRGLKAQFDMSYKSKTAWSTEDQTRLNNIYRTRATAIIWMRVEWALESNANFTTIISLSRKWNLFSTYGKVPPGSAYSVAVINLLAARRGDQSTLKWWSHLSFSDRDGTTSSRVSNLSNQRGKRTASEPSLWHASSRPQANVRGRRTTG